MNLTPAQLRTLRHMLGINTPDRAHPLPYRDYYCANPDDENLIELERAGAVYRGHAYTECVYWHCTEAGRAAALASFATIQWPKKRRVYRCFLILRDVFPDLTFRTFLTHSEYAEARRDA